MQYTDPIADHTLASDSLIGGIVLGGGISMLIVCAIEITKLRLGMTTAAMELAEEEDEERSENNSKRLST